MPMVTPTLNLPQLATAASSAKAAAPVAAAAPAQPPAALRATAPQAADAPSTTVTLSPRAMSALASSGHPSSGPAAAPAAALPAPAVHDGSVYEALKSGLSTAVADVGDAIAGGAHAVVQGVETTLSTANKVATGVLELPFAAVSKACDAAGALIDEL